MADARAEDALGRPVVTTEPFDQEKQHALDSLWAVVHTPIRRTPAGARRWAATPTTRSTLAERMRHQRRHVHEDRKLCRSRWRGVRW